MIDSIKLNAFPSFKNKRSPTDDKKEFPKQHNVSSHKNRFADVISQGVKKIRRKQSDDGLDKSVKGGKHTKLVSDHKSKSQIQMSEGTYENNTQPDTHRQLITTEALIDSQIKNNRNNNMHPNQIKFKDKGNKDNKKSKKNVEVTKPKK